MSLAPEFKDWPLGNPEPTWGFIPIAFHASYFKFIPLNRSIHRDEGEVERSTWAGGASFRSGLGRIGESFVEEAVQVVGEAEPRLQGHFVDVNEGRFGDKDVDDSLTRRGPIFVFLGRVDGGGGSGLIVCGG